jgi:hypothetical protein
MKDIELMIGSAILNYLLYGFNIKMHGVVQMVRRKLVLMIFF